MSDVCLCSVSMIRLAFASILVPIFVDSFGYYGAVQILIHSKFVGDMMKLQIGKLQIQ